jgi:hypothetical protein
MLGFGIMDESRVQKYQHLLYPRRSSGQRCSDIAAASSFPPGLEDYASVKSAIVAPSPSSLPTPFGLKNGEGPKTKLAPKQDVERGIVVELCGLPKSLMSKAMIETLVEQAEFSKDVRIMDITFAHSKALVMFANTSDAASFIDHCDGRPWNPKGPPISATLQAPTKGVKKSKPQKTTPKQKNDGAASISDKAAVHMAARQAETNFAYLNNAVCKQMQYRSQHDLNSETSTAVGDSDGEERLGFPLQTPSFKFGLHLQL